jgi:hypothetical protein
MEDHRGRVFVEVELMLMGLWSFHSFLSSGGNSQLSEL